MRERKMEPMCETSERGENLIQRQEVLPITLDIGRRIMEVFGYQKISHIVFRLKATRDEIDAVLNGKSLPTTELLLGIQKVTGASIDWLLTGEGVKYIRERNADNETIPTASTLVWTSTEDPSKPAHLM